MLSRKVSGSGLISATAGIDRGRVGERLQAALAGLQELHFLKEKQYDMVNWALQMDREEPACSIQTCTDDSRRGKARLEATLTALKQQLSRLRRQDVGLKTHLQQLDQQIIELKMDVCKASTEQLESDSRPSSGFYDLSDGGSCSLSNSYTSVYSECLSSCSQTSLLPPSCSSGPRTLSVSMQAEASRRRSADETTTQPNPPRGTGLHLGSSRIRTGTTGTERARQRPVSTGDLDRMMTPGLGFYKSVDVKKSSLCCNLKSTTVDPKYQSNLVSRGGAEVYHYPSPLHAVALQSPIFSLGIEPIVPAVPEGQGPADGVLSVDIIQRRRKGTEAKPLGYIDKLLQRSMGKINIQSEVGKDTVQMRPDDHSEASAVGAVCQEVPLVQVHTQQPAMLTDINPADRKRLSVVYSSQGQVNYCNPTQALRAPEISYRYSYPAALREFSPSEVHTTTGRVKPLAEDVREQAHPDLGCMEIQGRVTDRKASDRRPGGAVSSSTEEGQDTVGSLAGALSPDFVHAKFVPAGSQCVKVRQDRKTKAVRLRRRSSEKHRGMTLQQGHSSSDRTREASSSARGERELRVSGKARASQRLVSSLGEERWHSGSESSLCGPSLSYAPMSHAQTQPISASKSSKTCRPQYLDQEQHTDQRKRRQGTTKWLSGMETFQAMCVQGQRSREPQTQAAVSRSATVRSLNARPQSGQWGGPLCALQPSFYTSSYFSNINARYPPAPFPLSTHYPSRCESEYSADCASLFHSTIAESSEGELSDNTINRFGDSETSQSSKSPSDSDSSLSLDEGDQVESYEKVGHLVWAEAALGPTATGLPLEQLPRPEPPACRIKASRALKKKIRRFRPASMKVMTLV